MNQQVRHVIRIEQVHRPLTNKQWLVNARNNLRLKFGEAVVMSEAADAAYHVLNVAQVGQIPLLGREQTADIKKSLDKIRAASPENPTIGTTKVIIKGGRIMVGMVEDEGLVAERRAVLATLKEVLGIDIPYSPKYNVGAGRVLDPSQETAIRHHITDNLLPPTVELGALAVIGTLNGDKLISL